MALTKLNFTGQPTLPSANMPTGSVLQVKQSVIPKETITTSSATFVSAGHSLAITPSPPAIPQIVALYTPSTGQV